MRVFATVYARSCPRQPALSTVAAAVFEKPRSADGRLDRLTLGCVCCTPDLSAVSPLGVVRARRFGGVNIYIYSPFF